MLPALQLDLEAAEQRANTLRSGGKVHALGTLTSVAPELSVPSQGIDAVRCEAIGRRFWTKEVSSGGQTPQDGREAPHAEVDADVFWQTHRVQFPRAWPEKCALPVGVSDPASVGPKHRILAMDELVLSFWKFVGYVQAMIDARLAHQRRPASAEVLPGVKEELAALLATMEDARRLARNVPMTFIYCPTEQDRFSEALSLREDLEVFREYMGISGWQRVVIVGSKRDELRTVWRRQVKPEEISAALKCVRWSAGREMSPDTVEKLLQLYDKLAGQPRVVSLLKEAQNTFGRSGPFEEHSKMLCVVGRCSGNDEIVWVLESILMDMLAGKVDGFSKAELTKKHGPVSVYLLRRRMIEGLHSCFIRPSVQLAQEHSAKQPALVEVATAMQENANRFLSPRSFAEEVSPQASAGGQTPGGTCLPVWWTLHLTRLLRQVLTGLKDKTLIAALLKGTKGGLQSMKYAVLQELEGFKNDISEIEKMHKVWAMSLSEAPTESLVGGEKEVSPQPEEDKLGDSELKEELLSWYRVC